MKPCDHTHWLSLSTQGDRAVLLQAERPQALIRQITCPDLRHPSLFVLIGNSDKSTALRALFSLKRTQRFALKRNLGEIHLHLDPSSVFSSRPILIAEGDLPITKTNLKTAQSVKCHETTLRPFQRSFDTEQASLEIYGQLLSPLTDVFCFFSSDVGGFGQISCLLAQWIDTDRTSTHTKTVLPSVIIVEESDSSHLHHEKNERENFLRLLRDSTTKDPFDFIARIEIVAILPGGKVSNAARYRRLKERLIECSNKVRRKRREEHLLFSANHFAAFLEASCSHFLTSGELLDFVQASRAENPVALDLDEHLSRFLNMITPSALTCFAALYVASSLLLDNYTPQAHAFEPNRVFNSLYKNVFAGINIDKINSSITAGDFSNSARLQMNQYFQQLHNGGSDNSAIELHRSNLARFRGMLQDIRSSSTCLCCLRRRPQYCLPCGHCICENCVVVFGMRCKDDACIFKIRQCFLCNHKMKEEIRVRTRPPTAGAGLLCIDGGGVRGVIPLTIMKLIQARLGSIPLQRCIPLSFGVSVGRPLDESVKTFSDMVTQVFKPRVSSIPVISPLVQAIFAYFTDGLYPANNINAVLRDWMKGKSLLDCSHATSTGTKVGLPVATVSDLPLFRFFTNYNGTGDRDVEQERTVVKPKEGYANVPLCAIARSATAAPGFFPPEYIKEVGTFQDPGALENDPLPWALSEMSALFPRLKVPDFAISLGTGEPAQNSYDVSTEDRRGLRKYKMLPRIWSLIMEKMRDKTVRRVYKTPSYADRILPNYHRLNVDFESTEPRLDDAENIPDMIAKVEADKSLSERIDGVAHCLIASLFYFELDSLPEWRDGKYLLNGRILCCIRRSDATFEGLLTKLAQIQAKFWLNDGHIAKSVGDAACFGKDQNFSVRIQMEASDEFTISIKQGGSKVYSISGSPFTVKSLVHAQGLNAHFGRADHGKRKRSWQSRDFEHRRKRQRAPAYSGDE